MERNGGRWFELFAVESREDADDIIGTRRGLDNTGATPISVSATHERTRTDSRLIDGFHKLADHKRNALNPLNFFLCPYQLSLERSESMSASGSAP